MNDSLLVSHPERDRRPLRFVAFGLVTVLLFSALTMRLGYLQISNGTTYAARAEANRTVEQSVPAPRGLIYDRKGRLLVANVASFAVKIRPADLPFRQREDVASGSGGLLGMQPADILATLDSATGSRFEPVRVAQDVPEKTARLVSESSAQLPGVEVAIETRREYAMGPLMSHILGYTGPIDPVTLARLAPKGYLPDDSIGKAGLEATFEAALRGTYGQQLVERDATGRDVQVLQTQQAAIPGASLTLTIDTTVQKEAQAALQWGMKAAGLKRGVFIVMNPQTGEVLAMVSLPTYDNNLFAKGISTADFKALQADKAQPLIDNAVQAHYPPGSTYKLVAGTGGAAGQEDHADDADPHRALHPHPRHQVLGLEPPRLRHVQHHLRLRQLVRHVLLPGGRHARRRPPRLLGAHVRLRQADGHRPARRGRRASSRPTSGRSTRSASRCSPARRTRRASARATTSSRRSS